MPSLLNKPYITPLLILLCGAIQTLTLAPFNAWFLGPLSIPLLLWCTKALQPGHAGRPALHGWLFGVGLFGSGVSWVYVSIHTYGYASPPLAASLTLLFVAGLALFQAFQFWLFYKLKTPSLPLNALAFFAVWILSDAFRTDFLTGFPWLFLGYGHLNSPLAGWIPLIGVYGVTAIVVATGIALFLVLGQASKSVKINGAVLVILLWAVGPWLNTIQWTNDSGKQLSVAMLQINIPQELKWLPSQRRKTLHLLEDMTNEQWGHDLIIWPETAVPLLFDQALPLLDRIDQKAVEKNANIMTGVPYREVDTDTGLTTLHNSIYSFGMGEGINHKQKLVPFGEYVPLQEMLRGLIAFFDLPMSDFKRGPSDQLLLKSHDFNVAAFICYEVVYPDFVADRARNADYLLTISNDSWFGTSIGPLQHLEMAQFRAAENGRYMVRATNNGISAMINQKGRIIAQSEQFVETTLNSTVKIFEGRTPYSRLKSNLLFWPCAALLFFLALTRKRHKNEPEK